MMELPVYRLPRWSNVGITMFEKAKVFVFDAGKIIVAISVVLWFLASYGPKANMAAVDTKYEQLASNNPSADQQQLQTTVGGETHQDMFSTCITGRFARLKPVVPLHDPPIPESRASSTIAVTFNNRSHTTKHPLSSRIIFCIEQQANNS